MKCSCRTYDSRFFGCTTSIAFNWAFSRCPFSWMKFASRNFFDENFIVREGTWPVTMIQAEIFGNFGNGWDTLGFRNLIGMGTFVGILRWRIPFDFFKFFLFFALSSSLFALFIFWILDFALEGVGQGQVWAKKGQTRVVDRNPRRFRIGLNPRVRVTIAPLWAT